MSPLALHDARTLPAEAGLPVAAVRRLEADVTRLALLADPLDGHPPVRNVIDVGADPNHVRFTSRRIAEKEDGLVDRLRRPRDADFPVAAPEEAFELVLPGLE